MVLKFHKNHPVENVFAFVFVFVFVFVYVDVDVDEKLNRRLIVVRAWTVKSGLGFDGT